ncbi:LTA synthase family protein [Vagococcus coleopterorum]|uniref:LTA synthase family protein n=2 Tax=Vagococcus coleopterorum TaxID=2714946 RepID=A0A6G8APX8_9ENTE|nr:LTA synthase family protein [Vagococcus coleopterorum]QIL46992.1 LTA synthase family protein [Vagococcus coleopterorum]
MGFFTLLVLLSWAKAIFAYLVDFNLGVENAFQYFILFINPFATTIFILSAALYIKNKKASYITMLLLYTVMSILLFSNVTYYREFTDFITINTMLGAGKVSSGLGESALRLFRWYDFVYLLDLVILPVLLLRKKIKMEEKPMRGRFAIAITTCAVLFFLGNLTLAETSRPELLKRTFSRDYLVKYLGINAFTAYDGIQTFKTNQTRAQANENDVVNVEQYVADHRVKPNPDTFGMAKGRNVIYIHLESLQQFMINYKLKDENGVEHEVTPFLNSLYNGTDTYSFSNFFHQVKSGKTSDAETLLENSFFGLNQGPLFTQLGSKNTFQAAPAILGQKAGYTSAVFHGNAGTFWNRNETYKRLGYDYFFDASNYDVTAENSFQYGLHDKPFFNQSIQYLEHLQQPFYTKMIAVSNHYPYSEFKGDEAGFPIAQTNDTTINGYFATANYLDKAVEEFFNYLKDSGLYDKSMIILYGDHYGVSNSRNTELAPLLGKDAETWTDFDNAQLQRVPMMFHIPGTTTGGVQDTYGGQVDVLPTLLGLLGLDTKPYLMLGQDLLSPDRDGIVAFRNGDFLTSDYTVLHDVIYDNKTGELIAEPTPELSETIAALTDKVKLQLSNSDSLTNGDLLRFHDAGLTDVNPEDYNYTKQLPQLEAIEQELGAGSTSVYNQNKNTSTVDLYKTKTYKEYNEAK